MASAQNQFMGGESILTSNNSITTVISRADIPESSSGQCLIRASARRVSDGASKHWQFVCSFKRDGGDVVITSSANLLSAFGDTFDLAALVSCSTTVDASGSDIRVRVTGLASTNILWAAFMDGFYVYDV